MSQKESSPIGSSLHRVNAVGMAWYLEPDYPAILDIMEDAAGLPGTHKAWEKIARETESSLTRDGYVVIRAIIHPQAFAGWCAVRGLRVDAEARSAFASEYAAMQVGR